MDDPNDESIFINTFDYYKNMINNYSNNNVYQSYLENILVQPIASRTRNKQLTFLNNNIHSCRITGYAILHLYLLIKSYLKANHLQYHSIINVFNVFNEMIFNNNDKGIILNYMNKTNIQNYISPEKDHGLYLVKIYLYVQDFGYYDDQHTFILGLFGDNAYIISSWFDGKNVMSVEKKVFSKDFLLNILINGNNKNIFNLFQNNNEAPFNLPTINYEKDAILYYFHESLFEEIKGGKKINIRNLKKSKKNLVNSRKNLSKSRKNLSNSRKNLSKSRKNLSKSKKNMRVLKSKRRKYTIKKKKENTL